MVKLYIINFTIYTTMNIYFTTGYENPKKSAKAIKTIIQTIRNNGHKLIKRPFKAEYGSETYKVNEKKIDDIFDFLDKSVQKIYREATKRIKKSDIVIAEASHFLSPGLGFELGFALHEKKPVLVLVNKKSDVVMSEVIEGNPSKYFTYIKYESPQDLTRRIQEFLNEAKKQLDTKFILIISPEIDRYLEWAGDYKRMHKAQIVRNAVEKEMENDRDYKVYLKEQKK